MMLLIWLIIYDKQNSLAFCSVCELLARMAVKMKEANVLFNGTLNTFYIRIYGVGHMVKDHRNSQRGNPLPPLHGLQVLFSIGNKGYFICIMPQTG